MALARKRSLVQTHSLSSNRGENHAVRALEQELVFVGFLGLVCQAPVKRELGGEWAMGNIKSLKPKEQHEQLLAAADREQIVQYLESGADQDVNKIAVALARQCDLFVHFQRLWMMRVSDLDARLGTEQYMQNIYVNRRILHKQFTGTVSAEKVFRLSLIFLVYIPESICTHDRTGCNTPWSESIPAAIEYGTGSSPL